MSVSFEQFGKDLEDLKQKLKKEITNVIKDVGVEVFTALREPAPLGTPVITGWARSNWRISTKKPSSDTVKSEGDVSASNQAAVQSLQKFASKNDLTDVSHIYIYNRVPYIKKLNYKTARQSPTLFVEKSMQRGIDKLQTERIIK
jgi:hypothetical protein